MQTAGRTNISNLETDGQRISPELSTDFQKLFSVSDDSKFSTFVKLFWHEQEKYKNSLSSTAILFV